VLGGVGNALGNIGKVALGVAAAGLAAAVTEIGLATKAAMKSEEIQAQLAAVLKSTGGAAGVSAEMANQLASSLQNVTRFEDDVILSGENLLLTFTNIGKNTFPLATQNMLDMSQALGTDLKSSATMLGKALNNPTEGITALTRVGVNFTDQQKRQIEALQRAGKVEEAQALILKELQTEFGGSAEAAGNTFAGKLDRLKNKLGDIQEEIGGAFLPILTDIADVVLSKVAPAISGFVTEALPKITAFIRGLVGGFSDAPGRIQAALAPVIQYLGPIIRAVQRLVSVVQADMPLFQAVFANGLTFVQGIIATVGPYIQSALSGIVVTIGAIINTIARLWEQHGATVINVLSTAWNVITATIGGALAWVIGVIQGALTLISGIFLAAEQVLQGNWSGAWEFIKSYATLALQQVWHGIQTAFASILQIFGLTLDEFNLLWQTKLAQIVTIVTTALQNAINAAKAKITGFIAVGKGIIDGIVGAIRAGVGTITGAVGEAIRSAIAAAKAILGISSPSRVFADIGANLVKGFNQGIESLSSLPAVSVGVMAQGAIDTGYAAPARQVAAPLPAGGGLPLSGGGFRLYGATFNITTPDAESLMSQIEAMFLQGAGA
jgi:phage-related protein